MSDLTDAQINAALERGREANLRGPRAAAARYDRQAERVIVELTNGCLSQVEVLGAGFGLHWEELDADLSIPGLLAGLFRDPGPHGTAGWPRGLAGQGFGSTVERRQGRPATACGGRLIHYG